MNNIQRREFLDQGKKLALASGLLCIPSVSGMMDGPMGDIFIHHVFFWLKDPADRQKLLQFEEALMDLATIDAIHQFHLGKPAETRREVIDSSYQYSLLTIFKSRKEHDSYQVHPVHDAFRIVAGEMCSKVLVYDSVNLSL